VAAGGTVLRSRAVSLLGRALHDMWHAYSWRDGRRHVDSEQSCVLGGTVDPRVGCVATRVVSCWRITARLRRTVPPVRYGCPVPSEGRGTDFSQHGYLGLN